ncbi:4-(cytidine 5'-diphospho)-2-C-methyl-D-erythritol kinase [Bengtsoniella intestinalis]|uniref:4-(cytidine 5'-diphospho)-2-C-methyl-D-erythritol kinase n=1 Tax=Bengtsoniella intestinalis TaxID=3073143 RepID=UPI00391F53D3
MTYTIPAHGKLNLTLDIVAKRPDGYHDLEMVMQSVALHDVIHLTCGTGTGEIALSCDDERLPCNEKNIAYKAAAVFFADTAIPCDGVDIHIEKRIPMEAGMAGGSADGAAVLRGLCAHYAPDLSLETLETMGAKVGSDVAFCVREGTALAQGRGERLATLPPMPACHLLICKPEFGLSTPALFGRVRLEKLTVRPDTTAMIQALEQQNLPHIAQHLGNVFEQVLSPEEGAEIFAIKATMAVHGALGVLMTGSGPTVFGIFKEETALKEGKTALEGNGRQIFITTPV